MVNIKWEHTKYWTMLRDNELLDDPDTWEWLKELRPEWESDQPAIATEHIKTELGTHDRACLS
jgi:hypothetical protein